jgi:hypothetical protein
MYTYSHKCQIIRNKLTEEFEIEVFYEEGCIN